MTIARKNKGRSSWAVMLGGIALGLVFASAASAQPSPITLATVTEEVNQKMVKLFGPGGFQGVNSYGTGILVSPDGYVLTVASPLLDMSELLVHLADGRRLTAKVIVREPELDAALLKIDKVEDLPAFDVAKAAKAPLAQPGDWVLGFSNQFQIATRDEPMSVQHGVIASYSKLHGRRGIFDAPYTGDVYIVDAITNNPGAGGGALTNRKGELLGLIGKELRNSLSATWVNYAVPIQILASFVEKGMHGEYKPIERPKPTSGPGGYHGIILVPDVVERTPPYVEDTEPGSPAEKAGLRPDDLIVYVDGEKIVSIKEFRNLVEKARPGSVFKLEVRRGDKLTSIDLKLDEAKKP
ncbi:MAG TPA: trypsin-like peptidase domain-containing protein [Gemmataceae bacterium]|nr:trypsin-like peptidase domain-containing protein [Gemmataceae bacterium]